MEKRVWAGVGEESVKSLVDPRGGKHNGVVEKPLRRV